MTAREKAEGRGVPGESACRHTREQHTIVVFWSNVRPRALGESTIHAKRPAGGKKVTLDLHPTSCYDAYR